jgi:hypothetical protein
MAIRLRHEDGNIYLVEVRGMLRSDELKACQNELADEISRCPSVRLLVVLDEFDGWDPGGDWRDLSFYVRHGNAIERIVGDDAWRSGMLMFAGADLRRSRVEFFAENDRAKARTWLSA